MIDPQNNIDEIIGRSFKLYIQGHLLEMENLFNSIPSNASFDGVLKLKYNIIKAYLLMIKGEIEEPQKIITEIISQSMKTGKFIYVIDAYNILFEINERLQKLKESLELIETMSTLLNDNTKGTIITDEIIHRKIWLKLSEGRANWWTGKNKVALKLFEEALELSNKIQNQYDIGVSSRNVALIINQMDKKRGEELQLKALKIFREINNPPQLAWSLQNLGVFLTVDLRNHDQALKYLQESLEIREKIGDKYNIWWALLNIGGIYEELDKTDKALEFYEKCLNLSLELKNKRLSMMSYISIIELSINVGDVAKADDLLEKFMESAKEFNSQLHILANYYYFKARLSSLKDKFQDALEFMEKAGTDLLNDKDFMNYSVMTLGDLYCIMFSLELKNRTLAFSYLEDIKKYMEDATDKLVKAQMKENYDLGEAMIFKESLRIKEKAKAQGFLELAINDTKLPSWYKDIALIQLCGLYLTELEAFGDEKTLEDLKSLVSRIQDKAKLKNSNYLLIKAMFIQAKLLLVEGKLKSAESLLNEALTISQDKNLTILEKEVRNELNHLKEWKIFSFENTSVQERIQKAQISTYIKEAQKFIGISQINKI